MKKKIFNTMVLLAMIVLSLISFNIIKPNTVNAIESWDGFTSLFIPEGQNVSAGDRVKVELYANKDMWEYVSVSFKSTTSNDSFIAYLNDIKTDNPYFIVPNSVKNGEKYELRQIFLFDYNKETIGYATYKLDNTPFMNPGERKYFTVKSNQELKNIAIKGNKKITRNDKLYLDLEISGETPDLVTIGVKNKDNPSSVALLSVNNLNTNPYIDFTNMGTQRIEDGNYYISGVFINPNISNRYIGYSYEELKNKGFSSNLEFELVSKNNTATNTIDNTVAVETSVSEDILKSIKIDNEKVKLNEKVIVNLDTRKEIRQAMLNFEDKDNKNTMIVYLKEVNTSQPYFIIPFTTEPGKYELTYMMLKDEKGNKYQYSKNSSLASIKQYDFDKFNTKITIEDNVIDDLDLLSLDNEKIDTEIIERIKKIEGNVVIEINANTNPIITRELFEAIQGTSKVITIKNNDTEWTFSGNDIKEAKNIDTSVNIYKVSEENNINNMIDKGIVLEFAKNGELPGKCLIRVLANKDLNDILSDNMANVYYYNEEEGKFDKVMLHILKTDDNYYEFYINHNSKYVLTPKEIDNKYVSDSTVEYNSNDLNTTETEVKKDESINVTLILQIVAIVVCVIILILLLSGKILSNKKKNNRE